MIEVKLKGTEEIGKIDVEGVTKLYMKSIADLIREDIEKNLTDERVVSTSIGGNYGAPKPLSRGYLQWKLSHGKPPNIFQKERKLIHSVKSRKRGDYSYTVYVGGEADNYANYVNEKRRFFGISNSIIDYIEKTFKQMKIA